MGKNDNKIEVHIGGEVYKLSSPESPSYIKAVAKHIDQKVKEITSLKSASSINQKIRWLLIALNITDELFKEHRKTDNLTKELERKEMELGRKDSELEKYYLELGKSQEEELMLKEKLSELQLEISRLKLELNEFLIK